MKNFEFYIPTRLVFGHGVEEQVGKRAAEFGKRVLILYGSERIRKNGLLDRLEESLKQENVRIETYSGITENPTVETVDEICEVIRQKNIEVLLAVGGGSMIDAAKAASIGCYSEGSVWDFFSGEKVPEKSLPLGVVLTMAATASEANCTAVLSNEELGVKQVFGHPLLYPRFALMDPELTETVPPKQTAIGAIDIFAHAFERYFDLTEEGTLREELCSAVMRTVLKELPRAQEHPEDYDARCQLMWAATMAHSDMIGFGGVFVCHEMSHVLTEEYGIPHGMALGILMPAWLKYMLVDRPDIIAWFAKDVFEVKKEGRKDIDVAQEGIYRLQHYISERGLPVTLAEAGITSVDSRYLAKELLGENGSLGEKFVEVGFNEVQEIYELCIG